MCVCVCVCVCVLMICVCVNDVFLFQFDLNNSSFTVIDSPIYCSISHSHRRRHPVRFHLINQRDHDDGLHDCSDVLHDCS
jgi:hypothetical protein